MKKRTLAMLLALCMVLSLGAAAFADGEELVEPEGLPDGMWEEMSDEEKAELVEYLASKEAEHEQAKCEKPSESQDGEELSDAQKALAEAQAALDESLARNAASASSNAANAAMEGISAEEQVIYDENSIKITVTDLRYDSGKAVFTLRVDNAIADRELSLSCPDAVVNGWMVYGLSVWDGNQYIPAGGSGEVTVSIPYIALSDQMKAAVGAFSDIQLDISISGWTALHDLGDILRYRALCPVQTSIPTDQTAGVWKPAEPVYDADGVVFAPAGEAQIVEMDGGAYTGALLYCENNTDMLLSAGCTGGALDGAEQWMELMTADGGATFAMGLHGDPVPQLLQPGAKALLPLVCEDSEAFEAASELTASIGLQDVSGGQSLPEASLTIPLA